MDRESDGGCWGDAIGVYSRDGTSLLVSQALEQTIHACDEHHMAGVLTPRSLPQRITHQLLFLFTSEVTYQITREVGRSYLAAS